MCIYIRLRFFIGIFRALVDRRFKGIYRGFVVFNEEVIFDVSFVERIFRLVARYVFVVLFSVREAFGVRGFRVVDLRGVRGV